MLEYRINSNCWKKLFLLPNQYLWLFTVLIIWWLLSREAYSLKPNYKKEFSIVAKSYFLFLKWKWRFIWTSASPRMTNTWDLRYFLFFSYYVIFTITLSDMTITLSKKCRPRNPRVCDVLSIIIIIINKLHTCVLWLDKWQTHSKLVPTLRMHVSSPSHSYYCRQ